ncbi:DUF1364 domain-containing protein [Pseudomonas mendocina]|nr:DUF1364 domain-containing protein [Pseudomonas mendocina]MDV5862011.1 DUF1364 domain-containing protein [Pseudomonas mendocina]
MSKLTKLARGRDCQVRLVGICNGNPETTVLAHYRLAGTCGMGIKPHDLFGAWACSSCHDEIDRRSRRMDADSAALAHLEGVIRTQAILIKEGKVSA